MNFIFFYIFIYLFLAGDAAVRETFEETGIKTGTYAVFIWAASS